MCVCVFALCRDETASMAERVARKMAIAGVVLVALLLESMTFGTVAATSQPSSSSSSSAGTDQASNSNHDVPGLGMSSSDRAPPLTSRVVHTKYGAVSGVIVHLDGRNLDPVEAFKGVPYASPPVGSLRFMPPVTGALWSGVKKADR